MLFSTSLFAQGIIGLENFDLWVGEYELQSCESCPDIEFTEGFSLKDIKEFYIGAYVVPSNELPECAQTNKDIYFDYVLESSAGTLWTSFFSEGGVCYWGDELSKTLTITGNTFEYKLNKNGKVLVMKLTKIEENLFEIYQLVDDKPYRDFEFKAYLVRK